MNATRQFPQLDQGLPRLLGGRFEQRLEFRVGPVGPAARHPERQAQGHQPLLRAVVQIALQAAPRGVAGLDDPRPGGADLLELSFDLGLEPGMLERQAGRGRRDPDQLRLVPQLLVDG